MIKLLIVDDHLYLIRGLISVFEEHDEIKIIASADSGTDALEKLKTNDIDIVLLDILMPEMDGIECCKQIKSKYPYIKVIAFTGEYDTQILYKIWNNKADGILLKTCGLNELTETIISVMNGQKIIGVGVPSFFEEANAKHSSPQLTKKETEILKLLGSGLSRKEVANHLFINIETVHFHCKNIFRKFDSNKINLIIAEAKKSRIIK